MSPTVALPEDQNPDPAAAASAAYNFVPLPDTVVTVVSKEEIESCLTLDALKTLLNERLPGHDRYAPGRHTGYFTVSLTTASPLYLRCAVTRQRFDLQEDAG